MFVAEAPGRLGAEVTGVPLLGDRTGDRFEELLRHVGWRRSELFLTNAVLCNPRDEQGNNDAPTRNEIVNCSGYLKQTIDLVNPKVVITLGRMALEALRLIEDHGCELRKVVGAVIPWYDRKLGVLYHPAPRTVVHRSWRQQLKDAVRVSRAVSGVIDTERLRREILDEGVWEAMQLGPEATA